MTSTHERARTAVDDVGRAPAWGSGRRSAARVAVFLAPAVGLLALATALAGLLSTGGDGPTVVTNAWNERIVLHGQGLYRHDSAFVAGSGIGSDVTTLLFGLPLLVIAMVSTLRGSVRGRLLLLGTLVLEALLMPLIIVTTVVQLRLGLSFTPAEVVGPIVGFSVFGALAVVVLIALLRNVGDAVVKGGRA